VTAVTSQFHRPTAPPLVLIAAFAAAVAIRIAVAGPDGAGSVRAGLVFAAILTCLAVVAHAGVAVSMRALLIGVLGVGALVLPVLVTHGVGGHLDSTGYATWAPATVAVASAEEAFLRGALYDAVARARGVDAAVIVGAVAFAALHVPLYGWHAVPLDLAVGLALGALRVLTGTWIAPAVAHAGADLVGWWLL
jgi:membrane protease YdiL (CAAX protease family)